VLTGSVVFVSRIYEFECVHTRTYVIHCVGHKGRGSVFSCSRAKALNALSIAFVQLRLNTVWQRQDSYN